MASSHLSILPLPPSRLCPFSLSLDFLSVFLPMNVCVCVPNGAWFVYPKAIKKKEIVGCNENNEPGYMFPYGPGEAEIDKAEER